MAKGDPKTRQTDASVEEFLNSVADEQRRADSFRVLSMMERLSGEEPKMWGPAIIGFGSRPLKYASGRELDWPIIAFSPRKASLTLYIGAGTGRYEDLKAKLGKHSASKACLYIKRLTDVDEGVLAEMVAESVREHRG